MSSTIQQCMTVLIILLVLYNINALSNKAKLASIIHRVDHYRPCCDGLIAGRSLEALSSHARVTRLYAKKSSSSKKGSNISSKKGFGSKALKEEPAVAMELTSTSSPAPDGNIDATSDNTSITKDKDSKNGQTVDSLMKKYGISNGESIAAKNKKKSSKDVDPISRPFGEGILDRMPDQLQAKIDNFLITSTFIALFVVILSGIGLSIDAFKVVFPSIEIPDNVEQFSANVLSPAFTPGVGIFFMFSITLGLFKYAQLSSERTVYRE